MASKKGQWITEIDHSYPNKMSNRHVKLKYVSLQIMGKLSEKEERKKLQTVDGRSIRPSTVNVGTNRLRTLQVRKESGSFDEGKIRGWEEDNA